MITLFDGHQGPADSLVGIQHSYLLKKLNLPGGIVPTDWMGSGRDGRDVEFEAEFLCVIGASSAIARTHEARRKRSYLGFTRQVEQSEETDDKAKKPGRTPLPRGPWASAPMMSWLSQIPSLNKRVPPSNPQPQKQERCPIHCHTYHTATTCSRHSSRGNTYVNNLNVPPKERIAQAAFKFNVGGEYVQFPAPIGHFRCHRYLPPCNVECILVYAVRMFEYDYTVLRHRVIILKTSCNKYTTVC